MVRIEKLEMQGFKSFAKKTLLTFPSNFICVAGPNGSGKCLAGSSRIIFADGRIKTIKEIVEENISKSRNIEKLEDGFCSYDNAEDIEVFSVNPNTMKIEARRVSAFIKRKSPEFLLKIRTRTGKKIITTHYHPFFSFENGKLKVLKAGELKENINIVMPRKLEISRKSNELNIKNIIGKFKVDDLIYIPYSENLLKFVKGINEKYGGLNKTCYHFGLNYDNIRTVFDKQSMNVAYFSKIVDGFKDLSWLTEFKSKTTGRIRIPREIDRNLARFLGYVISEGRNTESRQIWFVNENKNIISDFAFSAKECFDLNAKEFNYKENAIDSIIFSQSLCKFLERVFDIKIGELSADKKVPEQIFSASNDIVAEFLSALFEGDAYICVKNGKKTTAYIEYSTASRQLADDISLLLLRFGIQSIIQEKIKYASNTREKIKRKYYSVYIYGIENLKPLANNLNFVGKKRKKLEELRKLSYKPNPNIDLVYGINPLVRELIKLAKINVKKLKKTYPKLDAYCYNQCEVSRGGLKEVVKIIEKFGQINSQARKIIKTLNAVADSDIFLDKIVEIEKVKPEEWVYDLSIEGNHNFVANSFIVHNSNTVDGVCFVLGRSSAKSLRADRMFEMIFNGGKSKQPAEFAKVALYFDNSNKKFPLEEQTVVVSRKINRKGISIYKLNGRTVTREKILEVLRPAHIQPDGHNIILQGDVTAVVEMSPLERREIIDEISGIAEYDEKREKAQRELLTVEERLREGEIILGERSALLAKLGQESKAAEEYNKLSKELEIVRASLAGKKLKDAEEAMQLLGKKISEKEKEAKKFEKDLEESEKKLEQSEKSLEELGKKVFEREKDIAIIREVERLRSEIERKQDRIDFAQAEQERLDGIIERLRALQADKPAQEILKLKKLGVYGTIGNLFTVEKEHRTAVEVATGHHLNDLVVADTETAIECVRFLKERRIGRATFLPLDKIKGREAGKKPTDSGAIGFAINLIDFDKKYFNAFSFVFGNTLVVDKIDTAKQIGVGKFRFATLDGDLLERSGAIIGGFYSSVRLGSDETAKYENMKNQLNQEIGKLKSEIVSLKKQLEQMTKEEIKGREEISEAGKQREQTIKNLEELRKKRKYLYERRMLMQNELNNLNIKKARLEAELENVKIEFENYAKEGLETYDSPAGALEKRMKELIIGIQKLGPINMKAIEEYKEQSLVYKELKEKVDKLTEEKNKIFSIMMEMESKRKETFVNTLSAVSEQFKQVFRDLTNGEAELKMEEPENMESGLIIEASPEGKRTINIDAMSGGEKTLTALAFLFAIQRFRPAPFYILDEIDAALDKPNTKKITELIKKYSAESQFLVITHNDTTVQAADCVYGVSMEEGESKLVGIKMPE